MQRYSAQDLRFQHGIDESCQVIVSTPVILLHLMRHAILTLDDFDLMIFDECHHCSGAHPYAVIMNEFYHLKDGSKTRPKIFGMTASPLAQSSAKLEQTRASLLQLQNLLDCEIVTIKDRRDLEGNYAIAEEHTIEYDLGGQIGNSDHTVIAFYSHFRRILDQCFTQTSEYAKTNKYKRTEDFLKSLKSLLGVLDRRISDLGYLGAVYPLILFLGFCCRRILYP